MQPRHLWLVALLLFATACTSSAANSDDAGTDATETTATTEFVPGTLPPDLIATYAGPDLGFSIGYPEGWIVEEDRNEGFVGFYGRLVPGDTFVENYNITVTEVGGDTDLARAAQLDASRLAVSVDGYAVVGGGDTTIDGVPAVGVVFDGESDGIPLRFFRLLALRDGKAYEFMFAANRDEFENFLPVIDQMLGTLRFEG